MQFARLGGTGPTVSRIGLGTNSFGRYLDQEAANQIVRAALDAGISLIDTANVYGGRFGSAETILGSALYGLERQRYFMATKVGFEFDETSGATRPMRLTKSNVRAALHESLRRLGLEYVDLLQVHAFHPSQNRDELIGALTAVQAEGLTRYVGVCRFPPAELQAVANEAASVDTGIVSHQQELSVLSSDDRLEEMSIAAAVNVGTIAFGVLAGGLLTGKYDAPRPPHSGRYLRPPYVSRERQLPKAIRREFLQFARAQGVAPARVALGAVLRIRDVSAALIGVTSAAQLRSLVDHEPWEPEDHELILLRRAVRGADQFTSIPH